MSGIVLVISGPAGVGKTTLCDRLLSNHKNCLTRVVTVTTRSPRKNEVNGVDYLFMSENEFQDHKDKGTFLEYAKIHGNWYGSLYSTVTEKLEENMDVLLNIDVQGMSYLKKMENKLAFLKGKVHTVFVKPSSINDLRERLNKRGQDTALNIEERLKAAEDEIKQCHRYDEIILSKTKSADYNFLDRFYISKSQIFNL